MLGGLVRGAGKALFNALSWHTSRKIVVIESDDWGSIRMPSKDVYNALIAKGYPVDTDPYNRFDTLESENDLQNVFDVLSQYRDKNGNHPVITANIIVANPDFERIRKNYFESYYHEPFTQTYMRYPNHARSLGLMKEGIARGLLYPQFHGREHLNVGLWLKALQERRRSARDSFDLNLFALNSNDTLGLRRNYMAAFDFYDAAQENSLSAIVKEGLDMFEKIFGFQSRSFIAPCYTWGAGLETVLYDQGVRYVQGIPKQKIPVIGSDRYAYKLHYTGEKNAIGQYYLVRNCFFEPSQSASLWGTDACLRSVATAFSWRMPAIIGAHRLNFIGGLDEKNRDENLRSLKRLLTTIQQRWPETEFLSSSQLGEAFGGGTAKSGR